MGSEGSFARAEDIKDNFESICNFESSTHPRTLTDSLQTMIAASLSKKAAHKLVNNSNISDISDISDNFDNYSGSVTIKNDVDKSDVKQHPITVLRSERCFLDMEEFFNANPER